MIPFWIGILVLIAVGFVLYYVSENINDFFYIILTLYSLLCLILFLWSLLVSAFSPSVYINTFDETTLVYSLKTESSVSGRFFLGSGFLDGTQNYYYYEEKEEGFILKHSNAETTLLIPIENGIPHITRSKGNPCDTLFNGTFLFGKLISPLTFCSKTLVVLDETIYIPSEYILFEYSVK